MAAYAALLSLNFTLEQHHQRSIVYPSQYPVQSIKETITSLLKLFQDHDYLIINEEFVELERETVEAAYAVDYVIDCHALDPALVKSGYNRTHSSNLFSEDEMVQIMEKFVSLREQASEMMEVTSQQVRVSQVPSGPSRSVYPSVAYNKIVGFNEELEKFISQITGEESNLHILPIAGMGGLGKTTLARLLFNDKRISMEFNIRIWCTISQSPDLQSVLSSFLQDLGVVEDQTNPGEQLHKLLYGKRYLIILDDVWSIDVWDTIKSFFPDDNNKSRIIITTRVISVANYIGSWVPHRLRFLTPAESWYLLQEKMFGKGECPLELKTIAKLIAEYCHGVPLVIVVIGGHLSKSDMAITSWEDVASRLESYIPIHDKEDWCLKILSFCYESLPVHLKPCFLYMGIFPEDHSIPVSLLIKMWVAEGFLKTNGDQCLEDVAMEYLLDLIQRNLILVTELSSSGKIEYLQIHDFLRDLCLEKAHEYDFLRSRTYLNLGMLPGADRNYAMHLLPHSSEVHRSISLRIGK